MTAQALSRRRLVAGIAIAPALPVAALASSNPDAALLALKARYDAADAALYQASLAANEAAEAAQVLPFPDALFVQNGDRHLGLLNYAGEARPDGRRMYQVEPENAQVRLLRRSFWKWHERIATEADGVPVGDIIARRVPWPEAQARADEIVAA